MVEQASAQEEPQARPGPIIIMPPEGYQPCQVHDFKFLGDTGNHICSRCRMKLIHFPDEMDEE